MKIQAYREDNNLIEWLRRLVDTFNKSQAILPWFKVGTSGAPTFQNGWTNWGGTTEDVAFRLKNEVELSIIGHVTAGPTGDSVIFQLPDSSYFPNKDTEFPAMAHIGANVEMASVEVHQDGTVWLHDISVAATHISIHIVVHLDN